MAASRRLSQLVPLGAAAACLAIIGGAALGQTKVKEVVVEAPQVVHQNLGRVPTGGYDELVSVDHHISFSDLDLTKAQDMATLQDRVRAAAKNGCEQLKKLYPLATHDPDCVRKAVAHTMPQVRAAAALR
jgi:UrcA family protein